MNCMNRIEFSYNYKGVVVKMKKNRKPEKRSTENFQIAVIGIIVIIIMIAIPIAIAAILIKLIGEEPTFEIAVGLVAQFMIWFIILFCRK